MENRKEDDVFYVTPKVGCKYFTKDRVYKAERWLRSCFHVHDDENHSVLCDMKECLHIGGGGWTEVTLEEMHEEYQKGINKPFYVTPTVGCDYLTEGRVYKAKWNKRKTLFDLSNDNNECTVCLMDGCFHLGGEDWKEVTLDEMYEEYYDYLDVKDQNGPWLLYDMKAIFNGSFKDGPLAFELTMLDGLYTISTHSLTIPFQNIMLVDFIKGCIGSGDYTPSIDLCAAQFIDLAAGDEDLTIEFARLFDSRRLNSF